MELSDLFNLSPSADALANHIQILSALASVRDVVPQIKAYPDAVYFNYFQLGISLLFSPKNGYKPTTGTTRSELREKDLALESIDIYNVPKLSPSSSKGGSTRKSELAFATYPGIPFSIKLAQVEGRTQSTFKVGEQTTGKEFVECLGEPARKGGGAGPSSGSIGIWCEWTADGMMVEFGGIEATALSGETDSILSLQGVGWIKRKAIQLGTITLFVKHYKDDKGEEHIDIDQASQPSMINPQQNSIFFRLSLAESQEPEKSVISLGKNANTVIICLAMRVQISELEEEFLKDGWTADTIEHGLVESHVASDTPKSGTSWIAHQTWGMQEINGERRYTRHVKFTGPKGEDIERLIVFDYLGPL
ncbi:hypothetical protein MIND_00470700 [Mycena indigotica]|uniref:Uncharacterized protein n=1 Tax=Mycena indigotica TaxID=2126181 RepID=A0A8H6SZL9_9AGAR|nr:uncharacterized protein MIND_00470700 [Mycena indigotica]KAF7306790.1 hypothetical protein MIND_00470700 [Mycena indigotica]